MTPLDVTCVGETMGQFVPTEGTITSAEHFDFHVAGSESNVASALARLGLAVAWASRIGEDAVGERIVTHLASAGVDVGLVETDPLRRTGIFLKEPAGTGRRVTYYREGSAASRLDRGLIDRVLARSPRVLFVSGISPALSSTSADAVDHALGQARAVGTAVAFDVNYRSALWPSRRRAAEELRELARRADVVFVGTEEAGELWGVDDPVAIRELLPQPELVVRRPPTDVFAFEGDSTTRVALPPVEVVESVGAGDAFAAGYLFARTRAMPPADRLRAGHVVAASALGRRGDEADVTAGELEAALAVFPGRGETP